MTDTNKVLRLAAQVAKAYEEIQVLEEAKRKADKELNDGGIKLNLARQELISAAQE